jgi:SpoVK/Ycf46/Vps4 family AAA+-type ATPase
MLEHILKLYVMAMAGDVRSPTPHLFGPPGCGKSTVVEQLAELLGVNLHIINVSRLSPLEVEGVQMPHGSGKDMVLRMLPATFWTQLKKGDIILFDEFLRGFPEVYNALLDIFTSRRVGAFVLPEVFIIAASNSTVAYDKALEDRLLHIPVPDPRKKKGAKKNIAQIIVDQLGLMPEMRDSAEMQTLLDTEVLPMYKILDSLGGRGSSSSATFEGTSVRNLIGQAKLREIQSAALAELLTFNNNKAMSKDKPQFVLLADGKFPPPDYETKAGKLPVDKLTPIQALNLAMNKQLLELEEARREKGTNEDDDTFIDDVGDEPPF